MVHLTKVSVEVVQLRLTLCNAMDYTVRGILQARILEWVAFPFFRGSSQSRDLTAIMFLEISGEITPERMKRQSQSKNSTQLWM